MEKAVLLFQPYTRLRLRLTQHICAWRSRIIQSLVLTSRQTSLVCSPRCIDAWQPSQDWDPDRKPLKTSMWNDFHDGREQPCHQPENHMAAYTSFTD